MLTQHTIKSSTSSARWLGSSRVHPRHARSTVTPRFKEGEDVDVKLHADGDVVPTIATGLMVGAMQGAFTPAAEQVKTVLAIVALALPLVCVITNKDQYDWVASTAAPVVLGASALELLATLPAAFLAFGSKLCSQLGAELNTKAAFYSCLATLAAAVYYDYGALWICAAYAVLSGLKTLRGTQDNKVFVVPAVVTGGLCYAIFDFLKNSSTTLVGQAAICIMLANVAWSTFQTSRTFASEVQDK